MSELTESLATALMEQRDTLNTALAAMHRTHVLLLQTLEHMGTTHPLDPNTMSSDQLNTLAERLWSHSSLESTITSVIDNMLDDEVSSKMDKAISSYVSNLEIEVECSASIRDGN
jgi:hypothetical protein